MFGYKSAPSKIYSYGAREPVENFNRVEEQMRRCHRYRNALVHLELTRRARIERALLRISPELAAVEGEIRAAEASISAAEEAIRKASASARKKVRPPEAVATIKRARENLRTLRTRRKELRNALFASPEWKVAQDEIESWWSSKQKKMRAASGLYWGNYLATEQTVEKSGRPPRFHRWDGEEKLTVQLQRGLPVPEAFACKDNRLRIEPVPDQAWQRGGRKLRRTRVWFRIGTMDDGRTPIWAVVPILLHRPLPADAEIKWAYLLRFRIGTHWHWRFQLVLSRKNGWPRHDCSPSGVVGIDVGWRMMEDGSLRVARWKGSDGAEGELALPPRWLAGMKKVEDLRSIRDKNFDAIRDRLFGWISRQGNAAVPQWLLDATRNLHQWKSQARLAALAIRWRTARFDGDHEIFEAVEAWRRQDKHLYEYEANLRDQLLRNREDRYRNFAAEMRRKYHTAVIEQLDLRDFAKLPPVEGDSQDGALREHNRDACLSFLIRSLKESFAELIQVPANNTTRACHNCHSLEDWDRKILMHTCSKCGTTYDQDINAAINLLRAASTVVPQGA